jgi:hypothetical protein
MDIKQLVKSSGIDAERTATELFGIAVEDFAAKPLNAALKSAFGDPDPANQPVNRNDGSWYATSYAASLANSQFRPKLKFLFRVEFLFQPKILEQFQAESATWKRNFQFLIKSVDRPKVDFEYEEVNLYNFRTKVLKKINHKELSLTFLDDVGNNVYEFFRFMMMVHSPITRRSAGASADVTDSNAAYGAGNGMLFSSDFGNKSDFAHRGVMNSDVGNAIQSIKVTQMFLKPGGPNDLDTAAKEVSFFFINPRIVSFDLDDVNHEANEANIFTMMFDYDFMIMSDQQTLLPLEPEKALPGVGGAPGDVQPTGRAGRGGQNPEGNNNPYTSILAGVGARAVQKITSDTIGRFTRRIPGLGSVGDTIGNIASGVTRNTIGGLASSLNQSFARPSRDVVVDTSTAGRDTSSYTTSTGVFGTDQPTPDDVA